MKRLEEYEEPILVTMSLDMDCGFMSVSMDDLDVEKSKTDKFEEGQYNEIY